MSDTDKKRLFVAMPYGEREACLDDREASNRVKINFNAVWKGILFPAIPQDFIAHPANELQESGIIDQLYIEWLLEADVVLADLTFGNPNVYYELGIRQALSKRGTVLVAQLGTALPFDVASQSVLNYDYFNATLLNKFQNNLQSRILKAALHEKDSPVHIFLPGLFVRRYEASETPELIINKLENQVAVLEAQLSSFKNRASVDRLLRRINDASEPNQLIALYNQILAKNILSIEVLEILAIRLRKVGMVKEAIAILEIAHASDTQDSDVLRELGFCYRKMGENYYQRAQEYFLAALNINDADPELHGMIGGMLKRQGEYEKAMEHYCKAHSLVRDDLYHLVNLGAISALLNLPEDAKKYYRDVLNLCERKIVNRTADYWTYLCQGEAAVAFGDEVLSKQAYKDALELKPPIEDVRSSSEQLEFFVSLGYQSVLAVEIQDTLMKPYLLK
jgi:tetratricopeptide (TPR) repeat protein